MVGVQQLRELQTQKQYGEAAQLVGAVSELVSYFDAYTDVRKIASLKDEVETIKLRLRRQVWDEVRSYVHRTASEEAAMATMPVSAEVPEIEDFDALTSGPPPRASLDMDRGDDDSATRGNVDVIRDCFLVVDALGAEDVQKMLDYVAEVYETDYVAHFPPSADRLENAMRRFKWLRDHLLTKFHSRLGKLMPPQWFCEFFVSVRLCSMTRERLQAQVDSVGDKIDVNLLVKLIESARGVEQQLDARLSSGVSQVLGMRPADMEPVDREAAARLRTVLSAHSVDIDDGGHMRFAGLISGGFESSMTQYVKYEEGQLLEVVSKLVATETWSQEVPIAQSAQHLILVVRKCFERCADITTRQPLFTLSKGFARVLEKYGHALQALLPPEGRVTGETSESMRALLVVRTAEYVRGNAEGLQSVVEHQVDSAFSSFVDYNPTIDLFGTISSQALATVVDSVVREGVRARSRERC